MLGPTRGTEDKKPIMPKKKGGGSKTGATPAASDAAPGRSRRRPTGAMARKPWEEPVPKAAPKKAKAEAKAPAPAPSSSRRRKATGAMARKPWEEEPAPKASPKKTKNKREEERGGRGREPEPEPEQEPQWDSVPFADYESANDEPEQERDLFEGEPEGEPLPSAISQWGQLSRVQQTAAAILGFTAQRWPAPEHLAVVEKQWEELTKEERTAAQVMRYTQEPWDAADSDDDGDDDDICTILSLGEWLGQLALGHIEDDVARALTWGRAAGGPEGTQLEALRDLKEADFEAMMAGLELEEALDVRFRAAAKNLKPPEDVHQAQLEPNAASHRLAGIDSHATWFVQDRDNAATKVQAVWRGRSQRKIPLPTPLTAVEAAAKVEWTAETRANVYNQVGGMSQKDQEELLEKMEREGNWVVKDADLQNYLLEEQAMGRLHTKKSKAAWEKSQASAEKRDAIQQFEKNKEDPEFRNKAATKPQALFRGYICRQKIKSQKETQQGAMFGVMKASGTLKRRRQLAIENKRHAAATKMSASYRGHVTRSELRKKRYEHDVKNLISHEDDHNEMGRILNTLERTATVDEPVEKSAHAKGAISIEESGFPLQES